MRRQEGMRVKYYVGLIATALLIVSALIQGILVPAYWAPDIVYDQIEAKTTLSPRVQAEMSRMLVRRVFQSALESAPARPPKLSGRPADSAGPVTDMMLKMARDTQKRALNPDKLLPDTYYRLTVSNVGPRPTRELRIVLCFPGVVVERKITCPTRPGMDATPTKVLDNSIPIGLTMGPTELVPREGMTIEVWYAQGTMDPAIAPDWPKATTAYMIYERGGARPVGPGNRPWVVPMLTILIGLLLLSTVSVTVAWRAAVRRQQRVPPTTPAADLAPDHSEPDDAQLPTEGTPGW